MVAQSAEEFRLLADQWAASRNRGEKEMAAWLQESVLPLLEVREAELERKQRQQQRLRRQIGSSAVVGFGGGGVAGERRYVWWWFGGECMLHEGDGSRCTRMCT